MTTLMPDSEKAQALLLSRTRKLAEPFSSATEQNNSFQYLQLSLNNHNVYYAIKQKTIDDVIYAKKLTTLPWLPAFIAGVINWQGMVLTVLDTNFLCTQVPCDAQFIECRIIILSHANKKVGLLVNNIHHFFHPSKTELTTQIKNPLNFNPDYFLGLLDQKTILLSGKAILMDPALEIK